MQWPPGFSNIFRIPNIYKLNDKHFPVILIDDVTLARTSWFLSCCIPVVAYTLVVFFSDSNLQRCLPPPLLAQFPPALQRPSVGEVRHFDCVDYATFSIELVMIIFFSVVKGKHSIFCSWQCAPSSYYTFLYPIDTRMYSFIPVVAYTLVVFFQTRTSPALPAASAPGAAPACSPGTQR